MPYVGVCDAMGFVWFFADLGLLDLCCGVGLGLGYVVGLLGF